MSCKVVKGSSVFRANKPAALAMKNCVANAAPSTELIAYLAIYLFTRVVQQQPQESAFCCKELNGEHQCIEPPECLALANALSPLNFGTNDLQSETEAQATKVKILKILRTTSTAYAKEQKKAPTPSVKKPTPRAPVKPPNANREKQDRFEELLGWFERERKVKNLHDRAFSEDRLLLLEVVHKCLTRANDPHVTHQDLKDITQFKSIGPQGNKNSRIEYNVGSGGFRVIVTYGKDGKSTSVIIGHTQKGSLFF